MYVSLAYGARKHDTLPNKCNVQLAILCLIEYIPEREGEDHRTSRVRLTTEGEPIVHSLQVKLSWLTLFYIVTSTVHTKSPSTNRQRLKSRMGIPCAKTNRHKLRFNAHVLHIATQPARHKTRKRARVSAVPL